MADMPQDLKDQIAKLEEMFTVPAEKLKEVTDHFVKELEKGPASMLDLRHEIRLTIENRSHKGRRKHRKHIYTRDFYAHAKALIREKAHDPDVDNELPDRRRDGYFPIARHGRD